MDEHNYSERLPLKRRKHSKTQKYRPVVKSQAPVLLLLAGKNFFRSRRTILDDMARGWESKSVEAQQAEAADQSTKGRTRLTAEQAARERHRETLRLARRRVLQQLETSRQPQHRELLQQALAELDQKLNESSQ